MEITTVSGVHPDFEGFRGFQAFTMRKDHLHTKLSTLSMVAALHEKKT